MENYIVSEQKGEILIISLNRPKLKNAINNAMYQSLTEELNAAEKSDAIKVVIITGEGNFCAGNDLKDFMDAPGNPDVLNHAHEFLLTISAFPKPIIAAVEGPAIGIGTSMLLHCDLVYCATNAVFQLPFVRLGVVPEAATSLLLPQQLGHRHAFELLVLGEPFGPEVAANYGLINEIVEDRVFDKAQSVAQTLAQLPTNAVLESKALIKRGTAQATCHAINYEIEVFAEALNGSEVPAAISAFLQKK